MHIRVSSSDGRRTSWISLNVCRLGAGQRRIWITCALGMATGARRRQSHIWAHRHGQPSTPIPYIEPFNPYAFKWKTVGEQRSKCQKARAALKTAGISCLPSRVFGWRKGRNCNITCISISSLQAGRATKVAYHTLSLYKLYTQKSTVR